MKITLYVGCGLAHVTEEFRMSMEAMKRDLRNTFEVLEFVGLTAGTERDVYQWDVEHCVETCDLFLAICDEASSGLGYELAIAVRERGIPVLAVAHNDAKVSRLILGAAMCHSNITFKRYTDLKEVKYMLISFAEEVGVLNEETFTFYYEALCSQCGVVTLIPVQKSKSDIPEKVRTKVLEQVRAGIRLKWTINPDEDEVSQLMQRVVCCKNPSHKLSFFDFIWPIGAA